MNPTDTKTLQERLKEMADGLGSKAIGDAGIKAWYIALKDFSIEEIVDALDTWLRTKPKMPAPADVRSILAGRLSDRIERQAVADREAFAAGAKRIVSDASKQIARANLGRIGMLLHSMRPEDPDEWWHRIIGRWRLGEPLEYAQTVNAKLAWERAGRPAEWIPPDEEARLEREAIQAEP